MNQISDEEVMKFFALVRAMRSAQKELHKTMTDRNAKVAMLLEAEVDDMLQRSYN